MSVIEFSDSLAFLEAAHPERPRGLLVPEAIGRVILNPEAPQHGQLDPISADELYYSLGSNWLDFYTVDTIDPNERYRFAHFRSEHYCMDGKISVSFSVKNTRKPYRSEKHPYIFPALLLDAALNYHSKQANKPIDELTGCWQEGYESINFARYQAARNSGASKKEAAFSTWTGRQAASHGFTRVKVENQLRLEGAIFAHFKRARPPLKLKLFTRG